MAEVVTVDEVSENLNLPDTSHDDEIQTYVDACTAHVEDQYGVVPAATRTEIALPNIGRDGVYRAWLSHPPVLEVTSITSADGTEYTTGITVTADGYIEHANLGSGRWVVVYQSGFEAIPADLKLAALEDIRGLYQPGQVGPPAAFGAFGIENTDTGSTHRPVRMWPRVDAWIESRRIPGIA